MWLVNKIKNNNIKKHTFKEISYEWLEKKENRIKSSTYLTYKYTIDKYLNPKFKNYTIKDLENYDFNKFVNELNKSFAPKTARDMTTILKSILQFTEDQYNAKIKIREIVSPRQNKSPLKILSKNEQKRLEKTCIEENTLRSIGIVICLNTGLRIGEICALKWKNIDIDRREIRVRKTLERLYDCNEKTQVIIDTPKSQNSVRDIPMTNKLYALLYKIKRKYDPEDYFLTGKKDKFIEPRKLQKLF